MKWRMNEAESSRRAVLVGRSCKGEGSCTGVWEILGGRTEGAVRGQRETKSMREAGASLCRVLKTRGQF